MDAILIEIVNRIIDFNIQSYYMLGIRCNTENINMEKYMDIITICDLNDIYNIPNTPIYYIKNNITINRDLDKFIYNNKFIFCKESKDISLLYILRLLYNIYYEFNKVNIINISHKFIIKKKLEELNYKKVIPQSKGFTETLYSIVDCIVKEIDYSINLKYDGIPCWIYVSERIPYTLIEQCKIKGGVKYNIKGYICNIKTTSQYLIFCEKVNIQGNDVYYIIDCLHSSDNYYNRFNYIKSKYYEENMNNISSLFLTCNNIVHPNYSISEYIKMGLSEHSDGLVIYSPNIPYKLKILENITVDIKLNHVSKKWETNIDMLKKIPLPDDIDFINRDLIYEISLYPLALKRIRYDRLNPNPDKLIENIISRSKKDMKYNNINVWSQQCINYFISINKAYKRFILCKHIPENSNIIDMGSGNKGDADTWEELSYRVIAVEKDKKRFTNLKKNTINNKKIISYNVDMLDIFNHIKNFSHKYTYVTMMRSITNNSSTYIEELISKCNENAIQKIIIIAVFPYNIQSKEISCNCNNKLHCKIETFIKDDIIYFNYYKGKQVEKYIDYCYDEQFWYYIGNKYNYKVELESQIDFSNKFCNENDLKYICTTDIAIIMSRHNIIDL